MKFLFFEDNAGGYHRTIVARNGETLVQSTSFASYEEAKQAARVVHAGAASASFEPLAGEIPPAELVAGGTPRAARDELDAERWLDEGGSFSSGHRLLPERPDARTRADPRGAQPVRAPRPAAEAGTEDRGRDQTLR